MFLLFATTVIVARWVSITEGSEADIWREGFVKRLDSGPLASDLPDPRRPPQLQLWLLSWNHNRLRVSADYHNLGAHPIDVPGLEIENKPMECWDFYPYATLEVSDEKDGGWRTLGSSPSKEGRTLSVSMVPNSLWQHPRGPENRTCYVELDAWRPLIGKVRYGRVVLRNGETSQTIVLTDLLPPKKVEKAKAE
jgi:hypothetical protein